jgi:transposase-like protein
MPRVSTQHENPSCPACQARDTIKRGKRRNRLQLLQIFQCIVCEHRFTGAPGKHKTYPLRTILEAVSIFNLGFSLTETQRIMLRKAQTDVPERTIRSWVSEFKPITPYARMRNAGKKLFEPQSIVRSITFHHQVYRFQFHQAKLELLFKSPAHQHRSESVSKHQSHQNRR